MDKDWVGNRYSVYNSLAASNHSNVDREQNDYYATNPKALEKFMDRAKKDNLTFTGTVWECACGEGHLSNVLIKYFNTCSTDIVDRGYVGFNGKIDFLGVTNRPFEHFDIITNPPYKYAKEFVEKSMELLQDSEKCIMFLKIQFLEGIARREMFAKYPPKYVYVNSERQTCAMNGEFIGKNGKEIGSAVCYCWFVWEKGFDGEPIIRWL